MLLELLRAAEAMQGGLRGTNPHEWRVLNVLAAYGPDLLASVASNAIIDARTARDVADRLLARGLIANNREGRDRVLRITPAGRRAIVTSSKGGHVASEVCAMLAAIEGRARAMLSDGEAKTAPPMSPAYSQRPAPTLSPFRYPGGKNWCIPHIRNWLAERRPVAFVEPYCGGGCVGLAIAAERLSDYVVLAEVDPDVAAVWHCCLTPRDATQLADRVAGFEVDQQSVRRVLETEPVDTMERAFRTLLRNRVSRGGILADGAGLFNRGEGDRGIASRWYPHTLARRIRRIAALRGRLRFVEGDGLEVIGQHARDAEAAFFVDPPYTMAGRRLYKHARVEHERLFRELAQVRGRVLMTYDDHQSIHDLAVRYQLRVERVPMRTTHHVRKHELLVIKEAAYR